MSTHCEQKQAKYDGSGTKPLELPSLPPIIFKGLANKSQVCVRHHPLAP